MRMIAVSMFIYHKLIVVKTCGLSQEERRNINSKSHIDNYGKGLYNNAMVKIKDEVWRNLLKDQAKESYFDYLWPAVMQEYDTHECYPPKEEIFRALDLCSYHDVKVVILGQDPYYQPNQANGLAFSVNKGCKLPPSLKNIFKALEYDLGIPSTTNGDLTGWAEQGVLLLNSTLTVRKGQALSHSRFGWETFTNRIMQVLNQSENPIVFMLWGNNARAKAKFITNKNHLVLESVHPSPLSFYHGFLTCKHFSKANHFLEKNNILPIDWSKSAKF